LGIVLLSDFNLIGYLPLPGADFRRHAFDYIVMSACVEQINRFAGVM